MRIKIPTGKAAVAVFALVGSVALTPADAATATYKAVWGLAAAETRCAGSLPPNQCTHQADSYASHQIGVDPFCAEAAVVNGGVETPLSELPFPCRATLYNARTYGVKESNGVCIGGPQIGIATNGTFTMESSLLPAPITIPVRVTNKNGVATVKGSGLVPGGTATVSAKFTAVCRDSDPKRGIWSGTFTFDAV